MDSAEDLQAWKERFVNEVAHALKGPISAAYSHLDILERRVRRGDDVGPAAERLEREIGRLLRALNNMLLYGRPPRLDPKKVRLIPFLEGLATAYTTGLEKPRAEVTLHVNGAPEEVTWDERTIKIAIGELVDNAVESTEPPHPIELHVESHEDGISLSVIDRGAGIPVDRLDHVLEPFYPQLRGRPGLGLAVVDKLIRAHGGRVEIESEPGRGTTVRLILPPAVSEDP